LVKVFMSFHPYRQKWTRQKVSTGGGDAGLELFNRMTSDIYNMAMVLVFILFVFFVGNVADQGDRRLGRVVGAEVPTWTTDIP
jgi:hypothetical protein